MALRVLQCPNRLCHVNLDVSIAPWRKDNIFGIFKVWHASQGQTKYDVYTSQKRLGQHHQSIKTSQKARRHARKAIEHARKQDKTKNMLGKALKHITK